MADTTFTVRPGATISVYGSEIDMETASGRAASSTPTNRHPSHMPAAIPRSQRYFWTISWQESEKRADDDFEVGHSKGFDNFMDLARDLLSAE